MKGTSINPPVLSKTLHFPESTQRRSAAPVMGELGLFLSSFVLFLFGAWPLFGQGSVFTYQGRLSVGGNAATGDYDFQLKLRDAAVSGGRWVARGSSRRWP
jgi:hypothetical protein